MQNLRRTLPPLGALVAFEAAARHLNFTVAAEELQAAISKQIRLLEDNLGQQLFIRAHRRIELTLEGRAFLHVVSQALQQMASAAVELRTPVEEASVIVSVSHAFAFLWLSRYLSKFTTAHPEVKLDLLVLAEPREPFGSPVHLTIIAGDGKWSGHEAVLLTREHVTPVCSPAYLERIGGLPDPASLMHADLLELDDAQPACITWRIWLTNHHVGQPRRPTTMRMDSYPLVIEAARAGLGVALGWYSLIEHYLQDGTLVSPMPGTLTTETGLYAVWPSGTTLSASACAFLNWLIDSWAEMPRRAEVPRRVMLRASG